MKYTLAYLAAILSCGIVNAADTNSATSEEIAISAPSVVKDKGLPFSLDFSETVGFYSFNDDFVSSNTTVEFGVTDWLNVSADLAAYSGDETDFGDLTFTGDVRVVNGQGGFFDTDKTTINAFFSLGVPLDGFYSSDSAVYTFGGNAGFGWGFWSLDLGGSYSIVDGTTFVSNLGGFIDGDYANVSGTVWYAGLIDGVSVGVKANETWSENAGDILTVGPVASWNITNSLSLSGEVGFTVLDNDLINGSSDFCGSVGLQFSF